MRTALVVAGSIVAAFAVIAVFERVAPRRMVRFWQRVANPVYGRAAGFVPGWVTLETTGRRTGRAHRVPVGGGVRGGSVWVAAGSRTADYVRNLQAHPEIRVRVHGRWRRGTAHLVPDDRPLLRALRINPANGLFVAIASPDPVTIRIDLER